MKKVDFILVGIILLLSVRCDYSWRIKQMEEVLDHLDLFSAPQILISKFDTLEHLILMLPDSVRDTLMFDFPCSRILTKGQFIDSLDLTRMKIVEVWKKQYLPSLIPFDFICELNLILCQNDIEISQFTYNYSCNGKTAFFYKRSHIEDHLKYYHRELYIQRNNLSVENCFRENMVTIDSTGRIYLLKPLYATGF